MRYVDTVEYVSMLRDLVREGKTVNLLVSGSSMAPFLVHQRDYIYFRAPDRPLRKGDMVFYQRDTGQFVMHRIQKVRKSMTKEDHVSREGHPAPEAEKSRVYDILGDNQTEIERGVRRDQIFAVVVKVQRKGKMICPGDFWWEFFARVWINMIPFRRAVLKGYTGIRRIAGRR